MTLTRMLKRRSIMLVKTETTYGTDPTPTEAANAILAIDSNIKEVIEKVERPTDQKYLGIRPSVAGEKSIEFSFKVEVQGSGTAGTAPRQGALLLACGMDETVVSGTSVTYEPVTGESTIYSCTIWHYIDGRCYKINGCVGSFKKTSEAGKIGLYEFTMKGKYTAPTNIALCSPTYETTIPPVGKSGTFTYNSKTTLIVGLMEVDIANVIAKRPDLSDATSLAGFTITDRKPSATINPEAQIETSYDFRGDQLTSPKQVSLVEGTTAGNIITTTIPKFNIENIEYGDNEGILLEPITAECAIDSGDDEISIAYT